jgi:hypothetical protein
LTSIGHEPPNILVNANIPDLGPADESKIQMIHQIAVAAGGLADVK